MIRIGNFFFAYRNWVFIAFYILLFLPSYSLFSAERNGENYHLWPIVLGLGITITGQIIRAVTIGLAYIIRGGRDKKVYAETLVTTGIFSHCRNPLYVGNILMLLGVGILSNSALYVLIMMPLFLFIYQSIVLAEENFLRQKFGVQFEAYCQKVNRWIPDPRGLGNTFGSMHFNGRRYVLKEYNTFFVWLGGIMLLLLLKYPMLYGNDLDLRNRLLGIGVVLILAGYFTVRYLKKSGRVKE